MLADLGLGSMTGTPFTLKSGLAWLPSGVAPGQVTAAESVIPEAPPVLPQSSLAHRAGNSGLKSRANSSGMTFPCDTLRVYEN